MAGTDPTIPITGIPTAKGTAVDANPATTTTTTTTTTARATTPLSTVTDHAPAPPPIAVDAADEVAHAPLQIDVCLVLCVSSDCISLVRCSPWDANIGIQHDLADDDFDNGASDADSAYISLGGSSRTGSITSSITNYVYENGRRYHAYRPGQYVLPNDEAEQERMDLHHHIWRLLLQGDMFTAPLAISKPDDETTSSGDFRILDLGCGTGIWAMDMADEFPRANVFGVDLSPIQPDWVPGNCRFHVDDYEDEWTYRDDEKFDYIHGRAVSGTVADWPTFYRQVRTHMKPGGWCEMQEYDAWIFSDDDSIERAPWTKEWVTKLDAASKSYGKQFNVARHHKKWMIDAGFEDVTEKVIRVSRANPVSCR